MVVYSLWAIIALLFAVNLVLVIWVNSAATRINELSARVARLESRPAKPAFDPIKEFKTL